MKRKTEKASLVPDVCKGHLLSIDDSLYVIGGKWKLKIIVALKEKKSIRFNELQRTIAGISARVLSSELKDLEMNGFVKRKVYADQTPVVVEYEPTDYGKTLRHVIKALSDWGNQHREKIRLERNGKSSSSSRR